MEAPTGWGSDDLSKFIDDARNNEFATFLQKSGSYRRLRDIDSLFCEALANLDDPPSVAPTFFFYRCHSAFRASVRLATSGQVPETFLTLRGALEFALYGVYFWRNEGDWELWCSREDSETHRKAVRKKFKVDAIFGAARSADTREADIARTLYDRCIDLGAHPNPLAVLGSVTFEETPEALHVDSSYLSAQTEGYELAMRSTAQVGVCSWSLLGQVFKERFQTRGLWDKCDVVKQGL